VSKALFQLQRGNLAVPSETARGPWDPTALHGGPVAALLARAVEHKEGGDGMETVRLTVELLRPVPLAPLTVKAAVVRPGARVRLLEATLSVAGKDVAIARGLQIRRAEVALPQRDPAFRSITQPQDPPPGPDEGRVEHSSWSPDVVAFHTAAVEHRFVEGSWAEPGPVTVWMRLLVPVVAGERPSPLQRAVAAADFANGIARVLPFETHVFINPDLSVHLARPPRGEWIGLRASTLLGASGNGMTDGELFDTTGRVGRSAQSIIVDTR
jgi:hypothetical protein